LSGALNVDIVAGGGAAGFRFGTFAAWRPGRCAWPRRDLNTAAVDERRAPGQLRFARFDHCTHGVVPAIGSPQRLRKQGLWSGTAMAARNRSV
jgi:hypothetical protein